jgi:outer membrane immunogenic protein
VLKFERVVHTPILLALVHPYHVAAQVLRGTGMKIIVAVALLVALPGAAFAQAPPPPPAPTLVVNMSGSGSASASSWLGGAQAGYNLQSGPWVYGLEADISATHLRSEFSAFLQSPTFPALTAAGNASSNIDWCGTARGRLGWSTGPLLFYGTGGLACGEVGLQSNLAASPLVLSSATSPLRVGWVAGGGIDYMWNPNIILSLGYQYVDLGRVSLASSTTATGSTLSENASVQARFQVVTFGISFRFPPMGAAQEGIWQGIYAGGHGGGAWGDRTNASYSASETLIAGSDVRLKRDIALVGRLGNGLGLYRYRYLWSDTVYVGVMAQEVALLRPDAIVRSALDDYLRVNYSRLGLKPIVCPVVALSALHDQLHPACKLTLLE